MTGSLMLWGLIAVAIFWGVGVHNRLMRMRAKGLQALSAVQESLREYAVLLQTQLAPGALTESPWSTLRANLESMEVACKDALSTPLSIQPLENLAASMHLVQSNWSDVRKHIADPVSLQNYLALQTAWDPIVQRTQVLRTSYNHQVARYNEAIGQFPARLVVGILGFQPAGTL